MKDAADLAILAAAGGAAGMLWFALPSPKPTVPAGVEATAVVAVPAPMPARPQAKASASTRPAEESPTPSDPASLARKLQIELKRVGCYDGEAHGVWSRPTRAAMRAFTERVNARLPVDKPDQILLALVQGHQGSACTATCGEGMVPVADGRCMPEAIPAKADPKPEAEPPRAARHANSASPAALPPPPAAARPPSPPPAEEAVAGSPPKAALVPIPAPVPRLVPAPREVTRAPEPPPASEPQRERRAARADGPAPSVGVREGRPRRHLRAPSRQVRYARSIFRSLKRAASNAFPFP